MDDDILSQGRDREPSRWPGRLGLLAVAVALIAGGTVYLSRPQHQPAPVSASSPPAGASPGVSGAAIVPGSPQVVSAGPDGIAGPSLAWDPVLRLPDATTRPAWFSPACPPTRRATSSPGSPAAGRCRRPQLRPPAGAVAAPGRRPLSGSWPTVPGR